MNFFGRAPAKTAKPRVSTKDTSAKIAELNANVTKLEKKEMHLSQQIAHKRNVIRGLMAQKPPAKERAQRMLVEVHGLEKRRSANSAFIMRAQKTLDAIEVAQDQLDALSDIKQQTALFKEVTGGADITADMEEAMADGDEIIGEADEMMESVMGAGMPAGIDMDAIDAELAAMTAEPEGETPAVTVAPTAAPVTPAMADLPAVPGLPAASTTPIMPVAPTTAAVAAPAPAPAAAAAVDADFAGLEDLMG